MPNLCGQAYALTVLTPILPGHEAALREHLERYGSGPESPLERAGKTHFARWVIIPHLVYQGKPQAQDLLKSQYLLFESNFDGSDLDAYLDDLCRAIPEELDAVWGHCAGYPGAGQPDRFKAYIRHNQIDTTFFAAAYPDATVADVRNALQLRKQCIDFAIRAQGMDPAALQEAFRAAFPSKDNERR